MRTDDLTRAPGARVLLPLRGPAQQSIAEFVAVHAPLPRRGRWARVFGWSPLHESSAQWFWRAVGQLDVGAALDRLGPEWSVFHSVPGPASPLGGPTWVDHLVIGPTGVVTVTAYDHTRQNVWVDRRAFVVDGHRLQYIRVAEAEVGHIERMLGDATEGAVTAGAVIAVINPGSLRVRDLPRDVRVIDANALIASLRGGERRLDTDRVRLLAAAVNRESIGPEGLAIATDDAAEAARDGAARDGAEFGRVRREVAMARVVRAVWTIGIAGLVAGTLVAVGILQLVDDRIVGL